MDWIFDRGIPVVLGLAILALLFGIVIVLPAGIANKAKQHETFMQQCQQDHKEYECTAMWRAGDTSFPVVIPMPMYVGR